MTEIGLQVFEDICVLLQLTTDALVLTRCVTSAANEIKSILIVFRNGYIRWTGEAQFEGVVGGVPYPHTRLVSTHLDC